MEAKRVLPLPKRHIFIVGETPVIEQDVLCKLVTALSGKPYHAPADAKQINPVTVPMAENYEIVVNCSSNARDKIVVDADICIGIFDCQKDKSEQTNRFNRYQLKTNACTMPLLIVLGLNVPERQYVPGLGVLTQFFNRLSDSNYYLGDTKISCIGNANEDPSRQIKYFVDAPTFMPYTDEKIKTSVLKNIKSHCELVNEEETFKEKVMAFKKIYTALREGQSIWGWLKSNYLSTIYPEEEHRPESLCRRIHGYASQHPNSRTAKAWELMQKYFPNSTADNPELLKEIYEWSFSQSGWFKKSKATNGGTFFSAASLTRDFKSGDVKLTGQKVPDNSRLGKIRNALK